jgi:hypothetical protein
MIRSLPICLCLCAGALFICGTYQTSYAADTAKAAAAPTTKDATAPTADENQLLQDNCTVCHSLKRVEKYKGKESWKAIVDRMSKKKKAKITADAVARLVTYLDKTYPKK